MESVLFNIAVGTACGLFIAWIFFKVKHGSFRQYSILLLKQAEEEIALQQQKKSAAIAQLEQSVFQEKKEIGILRDHLEKEKTLLQNALHQAEEEHRLLTERHEKVTEKETSIITSLEQISGFSIAEAKNELLTKAMASTKNELTKSVAKLSRIFEEEQAIRAQEILFSILERKTLGLTKDQFVDEIELPDSSFIPRFIGKDGRNIKTLSQELDLNIVLEESPPKLLISSYDPYKRAIARLTILALISSGKITPLTIHQTCIEQKEGCDESIKQEGVSTCKTIGIIKQLPQDVFREIGFMRYRSTAGQNLLLHSIDVAELMTMAAHELGMRVDKARVMGLLHDIGKTLSETWGTSHAIAGKNFLSHHGIDPEIVNAVASHHGEEAPQTNEARLLPICDNLSARLFGTRNDQGSPLLKIATQCEQIACQHPGVMAAWAHHASSHIELVVHHFPGTDLPCLQKTLDSSIPCPPILIRALTVAKESL